MTRPIDTLPELMAVAVRPWLATATREGYARYLLAMASYTRSSGERLDHAAAHTTDPELAAFFARMAREERGHFRLAEADLEALGVRPSAFDASDVERFHAAWMASTRPAHWLGALRVLEGVGHHLQTDAPKALGRLGLSAETTRFVRVHLDVDEEHGTSTAAWCEKETDAGTMTAAALDAAAFWVRLHSVLRA